VNGALPTEIALGMATRSEIQSAHDRLVARGVTSIVAVPLFISSHSTVVTSTEYLLGLRKEMPADLKIFATMSHGAAGEHSGHGGPAEDGTKPVALRVPVRMSAALNAHPVVADILRSRTSAISRRPANEAVILVAHGPNDDQANERWLADLRITGARLKSDGYASVDAMTVRDDAPKAVRDAATAELRALVKRRAAGGTRVLIVPALLSFGGIEAGIRKRLEGLDYEMTTAALAPDGRLVTWVLQMAKPQ
jgi:sirohydrochlorin ferrochelatase